VDDVIGFMLYNRTIESSSETPPKREIPQPPAYDERGIGAFATVAGAMVQQEDDTLASISGQDNDSATIRDFFGNEVLRQRSILDRGYLFTAANEAFLNYIDLSTIKALLSGSVDLPREKGSLGICLTSLQRPTITDRNFEWVVGADLRKAWAQDKLQNTNISGDLLEDEKLVKFNELMYGVAWCNVAKGLTLAAPSGGTPIDESAWRDFAAQKISEARALAPADQDVANRLDIAQGSYDNGRYGAAIYDAVYVIENVNTPANASGEETSVILAENRTSLWGRIYQSHAAFLFTQNETAVAYQTALFAKGLDEAAAKMAGLMQPATVARNSKPAGEGAMEQPAPQQLWIALAAAGLISLFLLVIALILLTRRADGDKRKGFGKALGASQKKGRA